MFLYVGWFVWVFELLILDHGVCGYEKKDDPHISASCQ